MAVELGDFEKVANSLRELLATGPVALRVLRPFTPFALDFDINFRDDAVVKEVEASGLSRAEYRQAIEDVEQVLASVVQGTDLERAEDADEGEDADVTASKVACVEKMFDIPDLKRRAWVKETGKTQVLFQSTWEVSIKKADETKGPPDDLAVPVGLLALKGASLQNPFSILTGADSDELVLMTDRSDLKALMETLRRLDRALAQFEPGGATEEGPPNEGTSHEP